MIDIAKILEEEKLKYEADKAEFESNPIHWSNNKRKIYGLPVLRGKINKGRSTKFRSFIPTPRIYFLFEDIINDTINDRLNNTEWFNDFVDVKNLSIGDKNVCYAE